MQKSKNWTAEKELTRHELTERAMATTADPFLSLSTPFLLVICPFLDPSDLLNLRLTCRRTLELLHQEHASEQLWRLMLTQNFAIDSEEDYTQTLAIAPPAENLPSIFGVPYNRAIHQVSSAFEAWKYWIKCSRRFYAHNSEDCPIRHLPLKRALLLHGPYFLRAAKLWSRVLEWTQNLELCATLGPRLEATLLFKRGMFHGGWAEYCNEPGLAACQAVYAFCGGTEVMPSSFEDPFGGLFGGYQMYDYSSCTHFIRPRALPSDRIMIAIDAFIGGDNKKTFCIHVNTGMVELHCANNLIIPAIDRSVLSKQTAGDETRGAVLKWLEEYVNRLCTGQIGVGVLGTGVYRQQSILLFPQITEASVMTTTMEEPAIVSRAVTRDVEVVASSVYAPQVARIIYYIRIRLLTPQDTDYVSAVDRSFDTCQLQTRHWRIYNTATGNVERVDGEGVVGRYPILHEGGYAEVAGGKVFPGSFSYTSCTGPMPGSLSGHLTFVPGSLSSPTGPSFDVILKPFALDNNPTFLY